MNGTDLLLQFKKSRSEESFSQLVRLYTDLVYSVARRRIADTSLAQEVTQLVFIRLAKAAPKLSSDGELTAWLHRTTVNASIDLWRSESRRRAREEQAVAMQAKPTEDEIWTELAPELDEALNQLNDPDRQAILLRFFDAKSMREVGELFGVSEDAAKMRVSRALDRLRQQLSSRGIACGAAVLGTMLADRAVEAAPTAFAAALATFSFPISASLSSGGGIFAALAESSRTRLAISVAGTVLIGATSFLLIRSLDRATSPAGGGGGQPARTGFPQNQQLAGINPDAAPGDAERGPDPLKLLQGVARARQRITSGSMEFQIWTDHLNRGRQETNHLVTKAVFDQGKVRFESFGREYTLIAAPEAIE